MLYSFHADRLLVEQIKCFIDLQLIKRQKNNTKLGFLLVYASVTPAVGSNVLGMQISIEPLLNDAPSIVV